MLFFDNKVVGRHLDIEASTLEIRAIEVTDNSVGDAPMLCKLLGQIPQAEPMASVIALERGAQVCNEALLNRFTQLGRPTTVAVAAMA